MLLQIAGYPSFSVFILLSILLHIVWILKSNWKKERKKVKSLSCVRLFGMPWTVAHQAPLTMEFSRQEYWSGLLFPPAGDLPDPGIEPASPVLAGGFFILRHLGSPSYSLSLIYWSKILKSFHEKATRQIHFLEIDLILKYSYSAHLVGLTSGFQDCC